MSPWGTNTRRLQIWLLLHYKSKYKTIPRQPRAYETHSLRLSALLSLFLVQTFQVISSSRAWIRLTSSSGSIEKSRFNCFYSYSILGSKNTDFKSMIFNFWFQRQFCFYVSGASNKCRLSKIQGQCPDVLPDQWIVLQSAVTSLQCILRITLYNCWNRELNETFYGTRGPDGI